MSQGSRLDPMSGIDLGVVATVLREQGVQLRGPLRAELVAGGRSNLTYRVEDGTEAWVVRRPPLAGLTPSAHDVGREFAVVDALQGSAVPVARTLASVGPEATGAPFTVVSFVEGRVLRTQADLADLTDEQLARTHTELVRVLAALHEVDPAAVGLGDFGRPEGYLARQLRRWRQQWDHVRGRDLPDLDLLHARLEERLPAEGAATIVHGDYRVDNTLLTPRADRVLAVVDWEMSTLGDPLADVATMCAYQHPDFDHLAGEPAACTSPRWPRAERIAEDYARASGRDLGDFDFYRALAFLKLAVVAEGIDARFRAGVGQGPGFATSGLAVPALVAAGLDVLGPA